MKSILANPHVLVASGVLGLLCTAPVWAQNKVQTHTQNTFEYQDREQLTERSTNTWSGQRTGQGSSQWSDAQNNSNAPIWANSRFYSVGETGGGNGGGRSGGGGGSGKGGRR